MRVRTLWLVEVDGAVATHDWSSDVPEESPCALLTDLVNGIWSVFADVVYGRP